MSDKYSKVDLKKYIADHITDKYYSESGYLNLDNVCKDLEISIYAVDFSDPSCSGAIQKTDKNWEIMVRKDDHINRKRFTVAHELGHYISYQCKSCSYEYIENNSFIADIMYRNSASITSKVQEMEKEANFIAAEILMPEETLKSYISFNMSMEEISANFGVSTEALSYRIRGLGYEII